MDLTKFSDNDLLALQKGDLSSLSDEGLSQLHGATIEQPKPVMSNENPYVQMARGFSQRGKEAAVGLAELTGLVPESVSQQVKAEREWVNQRPMAKTGSVAADIAMMTPATMVNPALASTISGGALLGAGYGYGTQPGNLNERLKTGTESMAGGAIGGAIGKTIGTAIPYAATVADRMTAPFREEGRKEIISRLLRRSIGENAPDVAKRLENPEIFVAGSKPTASEVGKSGGLSAIQRWAEQSIPEQFAFRGEANAAARKNALERIAGDEMAMDAARNIRRSETKPLYEKASLQSIPVDEELKGLLKRPSMSKALDYAENIAAEQGTPISQEMKNQILEGDETGKISGQGLHWLKIGLDAMRKDPKNPLTGAQQNALEGTINKFENWRETNIPDYAAAQLAYKELSRPVSQMQIGQELSKQLIPALSSGTKYTQETAKMFATAIRNADVLAKKATGFKGATYEGTMTPEQLSVIEGIRQDLARKAFSERIGRGVGSNTFQNFAMQDLAESAGYPGALLTRGINKIPLFGELLTDVTEAGVKNKEALMRADLADILLDPRKTAELLRMPEKQRAAFFKNERYSTMPSVIGASLANNRGE